MLSGMVGMRQYLMGTVEVVLTVVVCAAVVIVTGSWWLALAVGVVLTGVAWWVEAAWDRARRSAP